MCAMENMNLLHLDNDISNIIGGYVKKDNDEREKIEEKQKVKQALKEELFNYVDNRRIRGRVVGFNYDFNLDVFKI